MWADALAIVARADRLHREFFRPAPSGWEPPVDLLETEDELILVAALPGVRVADVDLVIGGGELAIIGLRRLPALPGSTRIHRMELPHGQFERRIALPPGSYELSRRDLVDGCLTVVLRKLT
jgi:HSP20 family molecular chaperone IbpA